MGPLDPARVHGGPGALGPAPHDFSTNANACGPCPQALQAVQAADARCYPDAAYTALRECLAAFHGVAPARIALAASASEFIFRITAWAAREGARHVWLPRHAYGDYAAAAQAWRLERVADPEAAHLAWACVPSSPTGAPEPMLARWAASPGVRVLDCAYAPLRLSGEPPPAAWAEGAWQLYTPNKALGLTGVRAAYAIAPAGGEADARAVDALCPSWPIGAHGVAMLQAWCELGAQRWLAQSLETLREWKARQVAACEGLGWRVLEGAGEANFFCAELPQGCDGAALLRGLRERGAQVRDCASFGLPGVVRVGVLGVQSQRVLAEQ